MRVKDFWPRLSRFHVYHPTSVMWQKPRLELFSSRKSCHRGKFLRDHHHPPPPVSAVLCFMEDRKLRLLSLLKQENFSNVRENVLSKLGRGILEEYSLKTWPKTALSEVLFSEVLIHQALKALPFEISGLHRLWQAAKRDVDETYERNLGGCESKSTRPRLSILACPAKVLDSR